MRVGFAYVLAAFCVFVTFRTLLVAVCFVSAIGGLWRSGLGALDFNDLSVRLENIPKFVLRVLQIIACRDSQELERREAYGEDQH